MIQIRSAYEPPTPDDGFRVLVDRLWPRGLKKEKVAVDLWLRDVGPSSELRQWFGHKHSRWHAFCRRYAKELEGKQDLLRFIRSKHKSGKVTLVFSARDREFNNAVALRNLLVSH